MQCIFPWMRCACALALMWIAMLATPAPVLGAGSTSPVELGFGTTQVVAVEDGGVPGGNGVFESFTKPVLNDTGQVAFSANLLDTAGGSLDNGVILRGTPSVLTTVLREGQPAPDGDGVFRFQNVVPPGPFSPEADSTGAAFPNRLPVPSINNLGQVVFKAWLSETTEGTVNGVYLGDGGPLSQLVRESASSPVGNLLFVSQPQQVNDLGQTLLLLQRDTGSGWYLADADGLAPIVENGQTLPGFDDPFSTGTSKLLLNHAGQVGIFQRNNGLLTVSDGVLTPSVLIVDPTPSDTGTVVTFIAPGFGLNNHGDIAFSGTFVGDEVAGFGLAIHSSGQNEFVVTPPDRDQQRVVAEEQPSGRPEVQGFNDAGQVLFTSDGQSLYRADGDTFVNLTEQFATLPDDNGRYEVFRVHGFNQKGQTLVEVIYSGTPGGTTDNQALLFCDDVVGCQQVVREGDEMLGSTVVGFDLTDRDPLNSLSNMINGLGQVAVRVFLADGREAVVLWTPTLPGDADLDYRVGMPDLDLLGLNFGEQVAGWNNADFNGDGVVGLLDLNALGANFGQSLLPGSGAAAVPEPGAVALLTLGALCVLRRRSTA